MWSGAVRNAGSDLEDLRLFVLEQLVQLTDVLVRVLLELRLRAPLDVFASCTSSLRSFMQSRRTLRTATLPSSASRCTSLTRSRRRSSVSAGIGRRITWPSLLGLSPRSLSMMARSMLFMVVLSNGCTVSSRASGAAMFAICLSGVRVP